ncbi:MAG: ATP-binding cassette domain-containing protein, partial [Lactococcus sp.]
MDVLLRLKNIDKRFQAVHALKNINLDIYRGETLALVGENGAGKSTLVKILTGAHKKDMGEMFLNDEKIEINSPQQAKEFGISQAYQRAEYIPALSVAENIFLGESDFAKRGFVSWGHMYEKAQNQLDFYGINISSHSLMKNLSIAE